MNYRKQRAEKGGTDFELCTAFVLVYPVRIPAGQGSVAKFRNSPKNMVS